MKAKHRLAAGLLCLVLAAGLALPACAHPRDENHRSRCRDAGDPSAGPCPYGDCVFEGPHRHGGTPYCGHSAAGGADEACPYGGCALEGWHLHDGAPYCGPGAAGTAPEACPYGGCPYGGWHLHGEAPCGAPQQTPAPRGGHHGGHHGGHC